jgi:subtilisin family serine protease
MRRIGLSLVIAVVVSVGTAIGAKPAWTQLSLETCDVTRFLKDNPDSDGRGVVIAVLDTGVDPSIPGLTQTSQGEVKVIDVQDFSGQGDTDLHVVRTDAEGKLVEFDADGVPVQYVLPDLEGGTAAERTFWFGWIEEKDFANSDVSDLNDNEKTDDRFPFFVTALAGDGDDQAVCYVDTNLDRSFAGEKPLHNYKLKYETFTLGRAAPEKQIVPLTFAVNIFLKQEKVVFHFDDGAHGTHVAGIAAGCRINNQDGFNGVAPGAKVISLKIGHGGLGGPSTTDAKKKAFEYAAKFAREHGMPVVCNLSYGVESTREGESAIDKFVNGHLRKNPYLVLCTSAGNEGPGMSSVGTPAAATEAITIGALLAVDTARDVMGYHLEKPIVTLFSSRGGELVKPDIVTPGWSTSTVPRWVREGDYWSGTSMASPYAAGLCALLIGHARAAQPDAGVRSCDVKRALELSATPPDNSNALDCGYGIPNMPKARDALKRLLAKSKDDAILDYSISTNCPAGPDGKAAAAYWRSTWFPDKDPQAFTIEPVFAPGADAGARTAFTRQFTLRSQTPWCKLPQTSFYLRSEQSARVYVEYDAAQLKKPGMYVGVVEAIDDDDVAFRLLNTIIVPERFTSEQNYARVFADRTAQGWNVERLFLATPPGASAMHVTLRAPEGAESKASMERIFDPVGFQDRQRTRSLDTQSGRREVSAAFSDDEFEPGVWEVDIVADRPDRSWPYELAIRFYGLQANPGVVTAFDDPDAEPSGDIIVTNLFDRPVQTSGEGQIEGFREKKDCTFKGLKDEYTTSIALGADESAVRLRLEFTPDAWAETTDVAVFIDDGSGKTLLKDAFSKSLFEGTVENPTPGVATSLKLRVVAGFAVSDDKRATSMSADIDHLLASPLDLEVTHGESPRVDFVPQTPVKVSFKAKAALPKAPSDSHAVGYLSFKERSNNLVALRVPIELED